MRIGFQRKDRRQTVDNDDFGFGMGVFPFIGVRVRYHHTIYIVYVGKHGNAHLVRCK